MEILCNRRLLVSRSHFTHHQCSSRFVSTLLSRYKYRPRTSRKSPRIIPESKSKKSRESTSLSKVEAASMASVDFLAIPLKRTIGNRRKKRVEDVENIHVSLYVETIKMKGEECRRKKKEERRKNGRFRDLRRRIYVHGSWIADRKHGHGQKRYANGDFYDGYVAAQSAGFD